MKSYVISHVSSRLPGPVQKRPQSCSNAPRFESNAAAPRPLCLSVLIGFEIRLLWFISPFKASRTLGPHPRPPSLGDLSVIILMHRSMTFRLRRCGIPFHKLTIKKVCVSCVSLQHQDLENDVGVRLTKACCAGIGGPADVRINHNQASNQASKVGDQVSGNLWHHTECMQDRPLPAPQNSLGTLNWPSPPCCHHCSKVAAYSWVTPPLCSTYSDILSSLSTSQNTGLRRTVLPSVPSLENRGCLG